MRLFLKKNKKWKTGDAKDRGNNGCGWKIKNYTRKKIIYIEGRQQHRNKTKQKSQPTVVSRKWSDDT